MTTPIGVFGATFDPPTLGHQDVVEQALLHFEQVLLVPSISHAFQKQMSDFSTRLAMLERFCQPWPKSKVRISLIEQTLLAQKQQGPIYTWDVLTALQSELGATVALHFIVGPDNVSIWDRFYRAEDIKANWALFLAKERKSIRSTKVRNLIQSKPDNLKQQLAALLPMPVIEYILENGLYQR